jgi:hypothetical protein
MRWYINDLSLQAQFMERASFEVVLRELLTRRITSGHIEGIVQ